MEDEKCNMSDGNEINDMAPSSFDNLTPKVQNPLQKVNLRTKDDSRPTFIHGLLEFSPKVEIIVALHEFKDCFVDIIKKCLA